MLLNRRCKIPLLSLCTALSLADCIPVTDRCGAAPVPNEAELATKLFQVAPGLRVDLWAAEPMLQNPVAFNFDAQGRAYICETFRLHAGVDDIRGIMGWLDEELAARTVDDRLAEMKRHLGADFFKYSDHSERIRLIEDRDGDGKADHSSTFADRFNTPLDGIGAGVLARNGNVWYANIPNLWLLGDTNQDGKADVRKSLLYGFGVRVGFLGHDLHGIHFGPDGRLYFSIGDRGSNLRMSNGKTVGEPDTGCVFRCNADGSDVEIFATGLRNPQDLVFDEFGNLFTGDNNSDSGDQARWVYLVEGGDSGWRVGYQFMESPYSRGPFNEEKIWRPHFPGQAAYIVPPITNIASGPSGVAYFPGTGLPDKYKGHFFLVDFRGAGANSGIHTFTLKPAGASFELINPERFIWGVLATDLKFGPDGGAYLSDWVTGWEMTGKGRIYRVHDPATDKDKTTVLETKKLLADGMNQRSLDKLIDLLSHADMRVRQEAQFELAERGAKGLKLLITVASKHSNRLARLHALWAIEQILSHRSAEPRGVFKIQGDNPKFDVVSNELRKAALNAAVKLLNDAEGEVRCQSAKILGELHCPFAYDGLCNLLTAGNARERFFAAMSLGKIGQGVPAILRMLRENADQDAYLRHAGVMALSRMADVAALSQAARDDSASVRMGALLAMRRLHLSDVALFLKDSDPGIVLEAARAINDEPINGAMPELAGLPDNPAFYSELKKFSGGTNDDTRVAMPLLRRVLNANFRMGTTESARRLAEFAARPEAPETMRVEALNELASWDRPSGRDRVVGLWRPVAATRERTVAVEVLQPQLANLLRHGGEKIQIAALHALKALRISQSADVLLALVGDSHFSGEVRAEVLKTLAELDHPAFPQALEQARTDSNEELRKAATLLQGGTGSLKALAATLETGTLGEKQTAFKALGGSKDPSADEILARSLDDLIAGKLPGELQLDLIDAAAKRSEPKLKQKLSAYNASRPKNDPLGEFREALMGGHVADGKKIFFERPEAQCVRCHKINGQGGDVGPDLSHIAAQKDRQFLLESIVFPNRQIAQGFESITLIDRNGEVYAGVFKKETDSEITINTPDHGLLTVKKNNVDSRRKSPSPMPEGIGQILSKSDLRDLVEFLNSLK